MNSLLDSCNPKLIPMRSHLLEDTTVARPRFGEAIHSSVISMSD
ncbi:MAG TPA: hypothetical protein VIV60_33305 [Polyangiaceae bacterium]